MPHIFKRGLFFSLSLFLISCSTDKNIKGYSDNSNSYGAGSYQLDDRRSYISFQLYHLFTNGEFQQDQPQDIGSDGPINRINIGKMYTDKQGNSVTTFFFSFSRYHSKKTYSNLTTELEELLEKYQPKICKYYEIKESITNKVTYRYSGYVSVVYGVCLNDETHEKREYMRSLSSRRQMFY